MSTAHPLIVDFPNNTLERDATKTVRFSATSTMKLVRYPTHDEKVARWYSKHDENAFKRRRWRDVRKYSAMLIQEDSDHKGKIIHCVGIDHLLSQDIQTESEKIMKARLDHLTLVLNVQELQRRHSICEPEDVARISAHSSRVAKERAHKVARIMGSL